MPRSVSTSNSGACVCTKGCLKTFGYCDQTTNVKRSPSFVSSSSQLASDSEITTILGLGACARTAYAQLNHIQPQPCAEWNIGSIGGTSAFLCTKLEIFV